jgi:2-oxo-3-hexenedioate decarboxylase
MTSTAMTTDIEGIAAEALTALDRGRQIATFSSRGPDFDVEEAYRVTAAIRRLRETRGERTIGRKIGFTNRTIWAEYGVYQPNWGFMYDRTVHDLAEVGDALPLAGLPEPRIEPEIVLGLASAPAPGTDERALLDCIDWIAHGFEIVQSIFPSWKFTASDATAAFAMHGALLIGPRHPVGARADEPGSGRVSGARTLLELPRWPLASLASAARADEWHRTLPTFAIDLVRDGTVADRGQAANVLGGPLSALRHLVDLLAHDRANPPLAAGEIVTTGTLTRALPVKAGESWSTALTGVALDGIRVRFV